VFIPRTLTHRAKLNNRRLSRANKCQIIQQITMKLDPVVFNKLNDSPAVLESASLDGDGNIGGRLRAVRELFGYSQRELARLAGVTNGSVSMIEQNQVSPSVASLKKLANAMSLTLAEFFTMELTRPDGPFFRAAQLVEIGGGMPSLCMVPAGVTNALLQLLHEVYPVGADTGPEMLSHVGQEAGVVVSGSVQVTVGAHQELLKKGDAYYFDSRIPHRFRNPGSVPCEIVSAATPRSF
jgi:transcriptional regulator with XRE-family HTH domain